MLADTRKDLGFAISVASLCGWLVCGAWGFVLSVAAAYQLGGVAAALLGLLLGPLTFVTLPLLALVALGSWQPVALSYGGLLGAVAILSLASLVSGTNRPWKRRPALEGLRRALGRAR